MARIQFRRDSAANWDLFNPVLADGELGIEKDTNSFKIGNGIDTWSDLDYFSAGGNSTSPVSSLVTEPAIISMPSTAVELTEVDVTISNYDESFFYYANVSGGTIDITSNPFKWTLPSVDATTDVRLDVFVYEAGKATAGSFATTAVTQLPIFAGDEMAVMNVNGADNKSIVVTADEGSSWGLVNTDVVVNNLYPLPKVVDNTNTSISTSLYKPKNDIVALTGSQVFTVKKEEFSLDTLSAYATPEESFNKIHSYLYDSIVDSFDYKMSRVRYTKDGKFLIRMIGLSQSIVVEKVDLATDNVVKALPINTSGAVYARNTMLAIDETTNEIIVAIIKPSQINNNFIKVIDIDTFEEVYTHTIGLDAFTVDCIEYIDGMVQVAGKGYVTSAQYACKVLTIEPRYNGYTIIDADKGHNLYGIVADTNNRVYPFKGVYGDIALLVLTGTAHPQIRYADYAYDTTHTYFQQATAPFAFTAWSTVPNSFLPLHIDGHTLWFYAYEAGSYIYKYDLNRNQLITRVPVATTNLTAVSYLNSVDMIVAVDINGNAQMYDLDLSPILSGQYSIATITQIRDMDISETSTGYVNSCYITDDGKLKIIAGEAGSFLASVLTSNVFGDYTLKYVADLSSRNLSSSIESAYMYPFEMYVDAKGLLDNNQRLLSAPVINGVTTSVTVDKNKKDNLTAILVDGTKTPLLNTTIVEQENGYSEFLLTDFGLTNPTDFKFNDVGTKCYVQSRASKTIYELVLSTAYDITTCTYAGVSFDYSSINASMTCFTISNNGKYLFMAHGAVVYRCDLSVAWDLSSCSLTVASTITLTEETGILGIDISEEGKFMFIVGTTLKAIARWDISTAWDLSTALKFEAIIPSGYTTFTSLRLEDAGKRLVLTMPNIAAGRVKVFTLTNAYDLSSYVTTIIFKDLWQLFGSAIPCLSFASNGNSIIFTSNTNKMYSIQLKTAYDINSMAHNPTIQLLATTPTITNMAYNNSTGHLSKIDELTNRAYSLNNSTLYVKELSTNTTLFSRNLSTFFTSFIGAAPTMMSFDVIDDTRIAIWVNYPSGYRDGLFIYDYVNALVISQYLVGSPNVAYMGGSCVIYNKLKEEILLVSSFSQSVPSCRTFDMNLTLKEQTALTGIYGTYTPQIWNNYIQHGNMVYIPMFAKTSIWGIFDINNPKNFRVVDLRTFSYSVQTMVNSEVCEDGTFWNVLVGYAGSTTYNKVAKHDSKGKVLAEIYIPSASKLVALNNNQVLVQSSTLIEKLEYSPITNTISKVGTVTATLGVTTSDYDTLVSTVSKYSGKFYDLNGSAIVVYDISELVDKKYTLTYDSTSKPVRAIVPNQAKQRLSISNISTDSYGRKIANMAPVIISEIDTVGVTIVDAQQVDEVFINLNL